MAWITLTATDVKEALTPQVYNLCATYILPGQADPVNDCLARATSEVRSRVAAHRANVLGPDGTLPDECQSSAAAIAAWLYVRKLQISDESILKNPRDAYKDAHTDLTRVSSGSKLIVPPTTASPNQAAQSVLTTLSAPRREMSQRHMLGL